jgi:hypothetical protein
MASYLRRRKCFGGGFSFGKTPVEYAEQTGSDGVLKHIKETLEMHSQEIDSAEDTRSLERMINQSSIKFYY